MFGLYLLVLQEDGQFSVELEDVDKSLNKLIPTLIMYLVLVLKCDRPTLSIELATTSANSSTPLNL